MFTTFAASPFPIRALIVFIFSLMVGWAINWAIYTLAYFPSKFGVWNRPAEGADPRTWLDWLPVIGWWRLRREVKYHHPNFWLRPFLLEIVFPLAMLWLYAHESSGANLPLPAARIAAAMQPQLSAQFLAHFVLIALMTVATFIDFDEKTIPDWITVGGTMFGLLGSATFPLWFPTWAVAGLGSSGLQLVEIHACTPGAWPPEWNAPRGLAMALAIVSVWAFALLDRRWIVRRGYAKALQYFWAGIFRTRWWIIVGAVWIIACTGVLLAWYMSTPRWQYLLSALLGLACAGGITWSVRIAAGLALRVEALGFGDVTLMAMIGTFIGWQASLLVFFVAPLMAVIIFVIVLIVTKRTAGAYGPYLCAGAAVIVVAWDYFATNWAPPLFELPAEILFGILIAAIFMLGSILWVWRLIKGNIRGLREQLDAERPN